MQVWNSGILACCALRIVTTYTYRWVSFILLVHSSQFFLPAKVLHKRHIPTWYMLSSKPQHPCVVVRRAKESPCLRKENAFSRYFYGKHRGPQNKSRNPSGRVFAFLKLFSLLMSRVRRTMWPATQHLLRFTTKQSFSATNTTFHSVFLSASAAK